MSKITLEWVRDYHHLIAARHKAAGTDRVAYEIHLAMRDAIDEHIKAEVTRECVTHHHACDCREAKFTDMAARLEAAERDASRWRSARDADPGNGHPYIARERQDPWGDWQTEWLGSLKADQAIDAAMQESGE